MEAASKYNFKEENIMVVQHNLSAMNTNRQMGVVTSALQKSTEKLSSGYKINRAGDDAAGLSISEKMRSQIRGLNKASDNAQDGISLIQVAEGALNETHTNTSTDRTAIKAEIDQLTSEINRIQSTTQFNTQNLLDGKFTSKNLQIGSLKGQTIKISISNMNAATLGVSGLTVDKNSTAGVSMSKIQAAIDKVSIHQQLSHVSVIQIWLMRWYSTARIIFFHRLDSQCLLRLISRHREFFHFSVNNYYYYYKQKSRCLHRLFLSLKKKRYINEI